MLPLKSSTSNQRWKGQPVEGLASATAGLVEKVGVLADRIVVFPVKLGFCGRKGAD